MFPAALSAAGSLALPLFAPAAIMVFGATVVDVVPPASVTVIPVSVSVMAARLVRCRRVRGSLSLFWHAGFMMVVLVACQHRPVVGLNNQWPVVVGLHVGPDVEGRGQPETLLGLQLTVQGLAARLVVPSELVGPLLPY